MPGKVAIEHTAQEKRARTFERQFVDFHFDFQAAAEGQRPGAVQPPDDPLDADRADALDLSPPAVVRPCYVQLEQVAQRGRSLLRARLDQREVVERQVA